MVWHISFLQILKLKIWTSVTGIWDFPKMTLLQPFLSSKFINIFTNFDIITEIWNDSYHLKEQSFHLIWIVWPHCGGHSNRNDFHLHMKCNYVISGNCNCVLNTYKKDGKSDLFRIAWTLLIADVQYSEIFK